MSDFSVTPTLTDFIRDAADGSMDPATSRSLRKQLAKYARELVTSDPVTAIAKFRESVEPLWKAGRAWVTEPAVAVLGTALARKLLNDRPNGYDDNHVLIMSDMERLKVDSDAAQENAAALAARATQGTGPSALIPG